MAGTRIEKDSFGTIEVPADRLWGAQTERSRRFFRISGERMPLAVVYALARVKKAAATVNAELRLLEVRKARAIERAAGEVLAGKRDEEFPLVVWQTGSGTQSNMNVKEVLANRASETLGGERGSRLLHRLSGWRCGCGSAPSAVPVAGWGKAQCRHAEVLRKAEPGSAVAPLARAKAESPPSFPQPCTT